MNIYVFNIKWLSERFFIIQDLIYNENKATLAITGTAHEDALDLS